MNPSTIIAIIALTGSIFTGMFTVLKNVKKSECMGASCERVNNNIQIDVDSDGVLEGVTIPKSNSSD